MNKPRCNGRGLFHAVASRLCRRKIDFGESGCHTAGRGIRRRQLLVESLEDRRLLSVGGSGVEITTTGSTAPAYLASFLIAENEPVPATNVSSTLIDLDDFRDDPRFTGVDGSGYAAVILDTGIDLDHAFFGPDSDSDGVADRIVYQWDYGNSDADASDVNGHGSNVASIVASSDSTYTGIAPGADIIVLKVFDDAGNGNFAWIEDALQWVVSNAASYNVVSVNMSLSDGENYSSATSLYGLGDELSALAAMDVIVSSSSGNEFYEFDPAQGVSYPSADPNSLSVGAVWDANVGGPWEWSSGAIDYTTAADRIVSFSLRHETLSDVFAPGSRITGANATGGTVTYGGTSQASPHIAGVAVLAQQLAEQELGRRLTLAEMRDLLADTAVVINDGDDEDDNVTNTGLDFPRVDMLALAEEIMAYVPEVVSIVRMDPDPTGPGSVDFAVTFNEDVSGVDASDFVLTTAGGLSAVEITAVSPGSGPAASYTVSVNVGSGSVDGTFRLDLIDDDSIFDGTGKALGGSGAGNGDFTSGEMYTIDVGVTAYPIAPTAVEPLGGLVYESTVAATIASAGDTDGFTLELEAGATITVVVGPDAGLVPSVELLDPGSASIASVNVASPDTAAGEDVVLQVVEIAEAGTYTILVGGADGTEGAYTAGVILNADVEAEEHDGGENDDSASAQDIDNSFITLDGVYSQRGAVLGTLQPGGGMNILIDSEDFESGVLDGQWTTYSSSATYGRIQISDAQGAGGGSNALLMDVNAQRRNNLNEAIWTVDLSGVAEAELTFYYMDYESASEANALPGDFTGHYNGDGVAISDDGVNWHTVLNAPDKTDGVWNQFTVDLDAAAVAAGMDLGAGFQIKLQQYDNSRLTSDGRGYDEIAITTPAAAEDWYSFTLDDGQTATLALAADTPDNLTLELYDSGLALLETGAATANLDSLIADFADATSDGTPDTYYVRITNGSASDYGLVVTRDAAFDSEANDSFATAQNMGTPVAIGYLDSGSGGGLDEADFHAIELDASDHVHVDTRTLFDDLALLPDNGLDSRIVVYDPSGVEIASDDGSASDGRNAGLSFDAAVAGSYRIQVSPQAGHGEYLLEVGVHNDAPPVINDISVSALLLNDADAGGTFAVAVDFSEPMDTTVAPVLAFGTDVSSTLVFDAGSSGWQDDDSYLAVYDVSDANVEQREITIDIGGGRDATGHDQHDYAPQPQFDIDTLNPTVAIDPLSTLDTTPQLTGTVDDPNASVEVAVDGNSYMANNNGDGTWTLADDTISPELAAAIYDIAVTATDTAGNLGTDTGSDELTIEEPIPGDFNLDGMVNVSDLGILATYYGQAENMTWANGDANGDFAVDVTDLGILATYYGTGTSTASASTDSVVVGDGAMPEPTNPTAHDAVLSSLARDIVGRSVSISKIAWPREAEYQLAKAGEPSLAVWDMVLARRTWWNASERLPGQADRGPHRGN